MHATALISIRVSLDWLELAERGPGPGVVELQLAEIGSQTHIARYPLRQAAPAPDAKASRWMRRVSS